MNYNCMRRIPDIVNSIILQSCTDNDIFRATSITRIHVKRNEPYQSHVTPLEGDWTGEQPLQTFQFRVHSWDSNAINFCDDYGHWLESLDKTAGEEHGITEVQLDFDLGPAPALENPVDTQPVENGGKACSWSQLL